MSLKSLFKFGVVSLLAAGLSVPAQAFGIGLQPTTVEMEVEPGERQRQIINLGNVHQEKTIALTIGLADWSLDETGNIELTAPGERLDSASNWVRFSPAFVTLKPGESEQIIVDMAAPIRTEREGDFRFALIASTILPEAKSGQSGVWKKYQIASLFYLTMGDAMSQPEITGTKIEKSESGEQNLLINFENDGNAHARLRGDVTISGEGDDISMPISNLVVLHEGKRTYSVSVPEELPNNPNISVALENIYAPQVSNRIDSLPVYAGPLAVEQIVADSAVATDLE